MITMMDKFKKAMKTYNLQQLFGKQIQEQKAGDARYNEPKEAPKADEKLVEETIEQTEIYRRAKELILKAQKKQVAYGLDKYPTPLSADVWDILETIDHILDESIDKTHYLVMLRIHLERMASKPQMVPNFDTEIQELYIIMHGYGEESRIADFTFYTEVDKVLERVALLNELEKSEPSDMYWFLILYNNSRYAEKR